VLVDAGWMAMSRDLGLPDAGNGYGVVCDVQGRVIEGLVMASANQEHGILAWRDGRSDPGLPQRLPLGTLVRILPNHACATAAQFGHYAVLQGDGSLQSWPRFNGW
jgi:D-serine deaminase-like pyridoxal phosphate-dependent protein